MSDETALQRGNLLGEYVLERPLGRGGFGEVWLGRHHIWKNRLAAVKVPTDPAFLKQLHAEGVVQADLAALESPHLVKVLGLNIRSNPPYLLLEYVEGQSLREVMLSRGRLPLPEAVSHTRAIALALQIAHGAGVVHGDIKPENVLVSVDGVTKLTDFNLCRRLDWQESLQLSADTSNESAARLAGTLLYMAPEQRQGAQPDTRSDLYSLGLVFFEMLAGEPPQPGDRPSDFAAGLPAWVDPFFLRCFARAERRFQSAAELLAALDPAVQPAETTAAPAAIPASAKDLDRLLADSPATAREPLPERTLAPHPSLAAVAAAPELAPAMALYAKGSFPAAARLFKKVLKEAPSHAEAWHALSLALLRSGEARDALEASRKAVALRPRSAEAHNQLGCVLFALDKPKDAVEAYRKAIALRPRYAGAHNNLGVALHALGKDEEARRCLHTARLLDPDNLEAGYNVTVSG
ncbi:MAG: protein kinase [Planctomycetes bacterium]|nr:protein kinase [Planctomycetota bacterium]